LLVADVHFAMSGSAAARRTQIVNCRRPPWETARLEQLKHRLKAASLVGGGGETLVTDAEASAALATAELNKEGGVAGAAVGALDGEEEAVESDGQQQDHYSGAVSALAAFDVKEAHCFCREDEEKLRRVIESESAEAFNDAIREAGASLQLASESGCLRASRIARSGNTPTPGTNTTGNPLSGADDFETAEDRALREEFEELDANRDGRLCRADLLRACGGGDKAEPEGSACGGAGGWMSSAQADELLRCVATTGAEIRVNGSLSIDLEGFKGWMQRQGRSKTGPL
jgi:hypothetical protein